MSIQMSPPAHSTLKPFPIVLNEQQVISFKFYLNNAVQSGMRYENELYQLARIFQSQARLAAYQFSNELIQQGVPVVISYSNHQYLVWSSLRHSRHMLEQHHFHGSCYQERESLRGGAKPTGFSRGMHESLSCEA